MMCLGLLNCTPPPETEYKPVGFDVNLELLNKARQISDTPFTIQTPLIMQPVDSLSFANYYSAIATDTNAYISLELENLSAADNGAVIMISRLVNPADSVRIFEPGYIHQLQATFQTNSVQRDKISINGIRAVQFIITSADYVNFKLFLLVETSQIQIDYFIPAALYQDLVEHIQSSIGSIIPKHTKE